jgi:signal transduction histidine kinase
MGATHADRPRAERRRSAHGRRAADRGAQATGWSPLEEERLLAWTHHLRSSLAGLAGLAEYLVDRREQLSAEQMETVLRHIHRASVRATAEVDDVLRRRSTGDFAAVHPEWVDVGALTREVVDGVPIADRLVDVRAPSMTAMIDPELFTHIVENLVVNARDHAGDASPIVVTCHGEGDRLELVIEDQGPGIPDDAKAELFRPGRTGNPGPGGHGIGLYLVARFAESLGGRVWVSDRPGGGAAFHVELPVRTDGPAEPGERDDQGP